MSRFFALIIPTLLIITSCTSTSQQWAVQESAQSSSTVTATDVCQLTCILLCQSSTFTVTGLPFSTSGLQAQQVELYSAGGGQLIATSQQGNCPFIDIHGPTTYQYWNSSIAAGSYELHIQFLVPSMGLVNHVTQPFNINYSSVQAVPAMAVHNLLPLSLVGGESNPLTTFAKNDPITLDVSGSADMCQYEIICTEVDAQGNTIGQYQDVMLTYVQGDPSTYYTNLRTQFSNLVSPPAAGVPIVKKYYRIGVLGTGCNYVPVYTQQIITLTSDYRANEALEELMPI